MTREKAERQAEYIRGALLGVAFPERRWYYLTGKLRELEAFLRAHCADCGRPLTDEESIVRGVGPECAKKAVAA